MKTALALFARALLARGAGQGEAAEADRLNADAVRLYRVGKYDEALPVAVQILVDETRRVIKAGALCGHPLLAKEAVGAALKARSTPTTFSGVPVKMSGVITYNFVPGGR